MLSGFLFRCLMDKLLFKESQSSPDLVKQLEHEARGLYADGDVNASLQKLQLAFKLYPSDRLQRKIDRLQSILVSQKALEIDDIDSLIVGTTNLSINDGKRITSSKQV